MSSLSMTMTAGVERGLRVAVCDFSREALGELCRRGMLSVSLDVALSALNLESLRAVSSRSKASIKRESLSKCKTLKPSMVVPCCGEVVEDWCKGVKFNHGLHTQCMNGVGSGDYCVTCSKHAGCSATGKPPYGDIRERVGKGVEYRDPKGKLTVPYANVVKKLGLDIEAGKVEVVRLGWSIPESQLVLRVTKRGRPSKSAAVSDTDSEGDVGPKKRGRKGKNVEKATDEDQIAALVAEAYAESGGENKNKSGKKGLKTLKLGKKVAKIGEKEATKAAKIAEKEATKAAKIGEKEATKAAKIAEKEATKAAKIAEKAATKAAKIAEKEATKAAKIAEKAAELLAKKEAKKAEKAAELLAKKEATASKKAEKAAELLAKKEAKKAEKAAELLAKKEAKKAEKEAVKAAKIAEKEEAKAAKEAAKAAKEAAKAAKIAEKEEAKAAKIAEKEVSKDANIAEKEAVVEDEIEDLEEEEIVSNDEDEYSTITVDGVEYYQVEHETGQIVVLSKDTEEPIGIYDAESKTIQECDFGDDSSDDEE
jgi:hypothetical protein